MTLVIPLFHPRCRPESRCFYSLLPESANLIHLKALVLHRSLLFSKCGLFPITPNLIAQAGEGG